MLLIDALNTKGGGGLVLLKYLASELRVRNIEFQVLTRKNLATFLNQNERIEHSLSKFGWFARNKIVSVAVQQTNPTTLFCFGNTPPPKAWNSISTITLFQNLHLLRSVDTLAYGLKNRLRYNLTARTIKKNLRHSKHWVFQSDYIKNNFIKEYQADSNTCVTLPFFNDQHLVTLAKTDNSNGQSDRFIYVSHGYSHKNHARLLDAWEILLKKNLRPELTLTINKECDAILSRIEELRGQGARIENLGIIPQEEAIEATRKCSYVIYPTLLETLGLGMVEGMMSGCRVLASDLPFVHEVIKPSAVFDPYDSNSIADVAEQALQHNLPKTEIRIKNCIDDLITLLQANDR